MSKVYAFMADGFELVECLAVVDILRRGNIDVVTVSVTGQKEVTSAQKVIVIADALYEETDLSDADGLFLPGGMPGTLNLMKHKALGEELKKAALAGKLICAICAAPSVLGQLGILVGKTCTAYPGFEDKLVEADPKVCAVVKDGNVITARGMGVATDLGLVILSALTSQQTADAVKKSIQHPDTLPEQIIIC